MKLASLPSQGFQNDALKAFKRSNPTGEEYGHRESTLHLSSCLLHVEAWISPEAEPERACSLDLLRRAIACC